MGRKEYVNWCVLKPKNLDNEYLYNWSIRSSWSIGWCSIAGSLDSIRRIIVISGAINRGLVISRAWIVSGSFDGCSVVSGGWVISGSDNRGLVINRGWVVDWSDYGGSVVNGTGVVNGYLRIASVWGGCLVVLGSRGSIVWVAVVVVGRVNWFGLVDGCLSVVIGLVTTGSSLAPSPLRTH